MRLRRLHLGRPAMLATWGVTRFVASISWRAARRPVARLWFTPWRIPISPGARTRHQRWLAATTPVRLTAGGRTLAGFKAGRGPKVLLVHGWSDRGASLGAFVGPFVDRGFSVVGVDLPGHGDSPGGRTNAFEMAEAIVEIDRELGGVDAIVAHSIGAFATILAMATGLDPRAVSLISPLVRADSAVDRFVQQLRLPRPAGKALRAHIEDRFGAGVWEELSADLVARGLETPALIVHDQDDPETSWSESSLLAEAWPRAQLVTTERLGHYRIARDPHVVAGIADFIEGALLSSTGATRTPAE